MTERAHHLACRALKHAHRIGRPVRVKQRELLQQCTLDPGNRRLVACLDADRHVSPGFLESPGARDEGAKPIVVLTGGVDGERGQREGGADGEEAR